MPSVLRLSARLLLLLAVLALLAAAIAWWALRGSLPQLAGELALPGLSAPVEIARDRNGVATIAAANQTDAMRALGFVHAQERYFEMDLLRRSAAGELAELFGAAALETDRNRRVHRLRARAEAWRQSLEPAQRGVFDAYTDGVNAGLAALRVRPWPYLPLRQAPLPWRVEDSALAGYAMFFDLHDSRNRRELERWDMQRRLPQALFALLTHGGSEWDAPMMSAPYGNAPLPTEEELDLRALHTPGADGTSALHLREAQALPGSNNWAVVGALTADGRAILANDMHLGQRVPNIWFRVRLRYADPDAPGGQVDATGASLSGVPALIVGSNGHVAWGFTNSYGDWLDWVQVRWTDRAAGRYRTAAGEETLSVFEETIAVRGAAPVTLAVRETRWGPVLHEIDKDTALALAWTAHRPGGLNFALTELLHAGDLDQALAIANRTGIPPQNFVAADAGGRIGWTIMGRIPRRVGDCDPLLPLDPLAGCDWDGWRDPAEIPRIVDPQDHRLWTANNRVADGQALAIIGDGGYDLGARAKQIRDGLRAHDTLAEADLLAIQLDDRALFLERWWALLRQTLDEAGDDPALRELEAATRQWEGHAGAEAVSYRLVRAFRGNVAKTVGDAYLSLTDDGRPTDADGNGRDAVLAELFGDRRLNQFEGVLWPLALERPAHLLPPGQQSWEALLHGAARAAAEELRGQPGGLAARTWGERNTAAICHPLAAAVPEPFKQWLCMPPDPLPGDSNMPRVQGRNFGASERMVVAPGHEADGYFHMPGGQSGHLLSPYWGAGHADWVQGRPTPFLPGPAEHRLRLRPDFERPSTRGGHGEPKE